MEIEKKRNFIINFLFYLIWIILGLFVLKYLLPLLMPFVVAFLIAFSLRKPIRFLQERLRLPGKLAAVVMVLVFYCTIGLLLTLLSFRLFWSMKEMIIQLPSLYTSQFEPLMQQIVKWLETLNLNFDPQWSTMLEEIFIQFSDAFGNLISNFSMGALSWVSGAAVSVPGQVLSVFLTIISSFFIAVDYDRITSFFVRQLNDTHSRLLLEIRDYIVGTLFLCIRSYALIMTITFFELSIGLSLLKIENAILIALLIAIFDILPVLGTGGIMIPWVGIVFLQGNYSLALGLLVVYLVITVIRNIIEPKIVGAQLGLHPVLTLVSMFVGANYFGFLGMFGFPILLSLLKDLNDKGIIRLYQK